MDIIFTKFLACAFTLYLYAFDIWLALTLLYTSVYVVYIYLYLRDIYTQDSYKFCDTYVWTF